VGFGKYLKAALLNPWNLLALLGSMGFAALSPMPDVLLPVVIAVEVAYLGLIGTHPKFQKYVEAQDAKAQRQGGKVTAEQARQRIVAALPKPLLHRFETLRARCREFLHIAEQLRDPQGSSSPLPLEELQTAGLDRLLWIYLRLLHTQFSLESFLQKTGERDISDDIRNLEQRLAELPPTSADPQREKVRKALEDNLDTCRTRLGNFRKAHDNYELVKLEIDRLENKITALSELAVNRHEPDFVSGQVDEVASSMVQTERTMSELQFLTGLETSDSEVPTMLGRESIAQS
jgi:hypothetical protein